MFLLASLASDFQQTDFICKDANAVGLLDVHCILSLTPTT